MSTWMNAKRKYLSLFFINVSPHLCAFLPPQRYLWYITFILMRITRTSGEAFKWLDQCGSQRTPVLCIKIITSNTKTNERRCRFSVLVYWSVDAVNGGRGNQSNFRTVYEGFEKFRAGCTKLGQVAQIHVIIETRTKVTSAFTVLNASLIVGEINE